ncbi:MAG TPA: glycosyltransferase family 4 protein [Actinomycetota bacterium]|jgi:glycosyltransferase involved in cell wall biosynthesis
MRILFVCGEYPLVGGGLGAYVKSLAPALAARGHEVHVLSCLGGQRQRDYRDGPVHVHERGKVTVRLGVRRLLGGPEAWDRLVSALSCRLEQARLGVVFDVIEVADFGAEGLLLGVGRGVRVVAHLHGPFRLINQYNGIRRGRDVRLAEWLERMAVDRADLVTAPSELVSRTLRDARWLRGRPPRTVRNPVDLDRWETVAPLAGTRRPLVLAVGRVEPLKGSEVLVRAAATLAEQVGNVEVVLVGRSSGQREGLPYREWVRKLSARLGRRAASSSRSPGTSFGAGMRRRGWSRCRAVTTPSRWGAGGDGLWPSGRLLIGDGTCRAGSGFRGRHRGAVGRRRPARAGAAAVRPGSRGGADRRRARQAAGPDGLLAGADRRRTRGLLSRGTRSTVGRRGGEV